MRPLDGARVHIVGVVLTGLAATAAIGGVHPPVQVALSASALLWFAILVWRRGARGLRVLPFVAPAALALGFTLVQLVPLPRALVGLISPAALELREGALGHAPAWLPLTVDVPATLLELVKGFACLGLLITTAHLCRRRSNARVVLWPLAFLGVALGALVMAQRLTGASTILGYHVRATLGVGFFGTLVCGNHAASIFALSALCAVGLAVEKEGAARFVLAWAAASSAAGLFYTTSRGGACGFAIGGALLVAIVVGRRVGRLQGVLAAAILLMVATGGALWLADGLRSRLVPSSTHEIWSNPKTRGMRDGLVLARHFPWTGVGRGAFEAPVAAYRAVEDGVRLVYPENLPVELAAEYGLPIAAALLVLAVMSARRVRQRLSKLETGVVGAGCGALAVVVHELADFGLEFPGVAFPTALAVGVVVGRWWDKGSSSEPLARVKPAWGAAAACAWALAIAGGAWAQSRTLDADSRRAFELHKAGDPHALDELRAAIARHPASDYLELLAATEALKTADPSGLKHLNRALLLHPNNWQAHRLAARELAALGRPAQAAIEYRLAIESGMGVYYDELWSVLHARVLDAVPQHSSELILLGGWLAQQGKVREADLACQRAVEVATRPESAARDRLHVAVVGGDKATVARAAQALLALRPEPAAWSQAAEALAGAGDAAAAMAAARAGMAVYPDEAQLVLTAARLAYQGNDLQSARDLLKRADDGSATLADRQLAAELLAQVADKAGDVDAAVLARARARLLARKLKDSGPSRVY